MDFEFDLPDTRTLSEEGVWFTPLGMDGKPLGKPDKPVRLKLMGPDSDVYRHKIRGQVRRKVRGLATGVTDDADAEEDRFTVELLAALTLDWEGITTKTGEAIPFSQEAVTALYQGFPRIRDQVDAWVANIGNFTTAP